MSVERVREREREYHKRGVHVCGENVHLNWKVPRSLFGLVKRSSLDKNLATSVLTPRAGRLRKVGNVGFRVRKRQTLFNYFS